MGNRYIDDLICRDRDTSNSSTLTERLYSLADPNWNVVALVDASGSVQERYNYNAFGKHSIYENNGTARTSSSYAWTRTFTGQVLDTDTGIMLYRNRYYHPTLGRFVNRDPIGYEGMDINLYRGVRNSTINIRDYIGLDPGEMWINSYTWKESTNDYWKNAPGIEEKILQMQKSLEDCIEKKQLSCDDSKKARELLDNLIKKARSTDNTRVFQCCWNWVKDVDAAGWKGVVGTIEFDSQAWDYKFYAYTFGRFSDGVLGHQALSVSICGEIFYLDNGWWGPIFKPEDVPSTVIPFKS